MAGSNDFTGQNIQDTYQRVLQLSSSGQIADGTGSLVPLLKVTASFAISASHEITLEISSSHSQNSDNALNAITASHALTASSANDGFLFRGNVTASGNISASGTVIANKFQINNLNSIFENAAGNLSFGQGGSVPIIVNHITSSGNISASGNVLTNGIFVDQVESLGINSSAEATLFGGAGLSKILIGKGNQEIPTFIGGAITASNNISSSGTIIGNALSLFGLSDATETKALMINSSKVVSTRTLGSNAFTSTTIGTTTNALTVDDATLQLDSGTTFNGSAARTISVKDGGIDSDALAANIAVTQLTASIISASENILVHGNVSGSSTNTGSFGSLFLHNGSFDIQTGNTYTFNPSAGTGNIEFNVGVSNMSIHSSDQLALTCVDKIIELGNAANIAHVTSSGNISASGNILGDTFVSNGIPVLNNPGGATTNTTLNSVSRGLLVQGTKIQLNAEVTASQGLEVIGNVSASGDLIGGGLNITGTTTFNDGNITNVGNIDVDQVRADANTGTFINLGADSITNTIGGANVVELTTKRIKLGVDANTHITASGNISGSNTTNLIIGGFISASNVIVDDLTINDDLIVVDDSSVGGDLTVTGNITANGNIDGDGATDITNMNDIFLDGVVHKGDTNTKIEFATDKITFTAGGVDLLTLTEDSTDTIALGAAVSSHITASKNISGSLTGTISAGSGSYHILQGDTSQPTSLFVDGQITASGTISSSGVLFGSNLQAAGNSSIDGKLHVGGTAQPSGILKVTGTSEFTSHITASGNISSSGDVISATSKIGLRDLGNTEHTTIGTTAQGDIFYHHSGVTTIPGAIYNFASNGNIALTQTSSFENRTSTGSIFMAVGTNSANDGLLLRGVIKGHTAHANSYGQVLYLSSNGSSSASPPTATDSFARVIGHQLSGSGTIYFNPDNTFVKVS